MARQTCIVTSPQVPYTGRQGVPRVQQGFTLIEMLLVVTIIMILLAMLLPAFKHPGQGTRCQANLSYIFAATQTYAIDNITYYPGARQWVWGSWWYDVTKVRRGTLYKYMGQHEAAYICPLFEKTRPDWDSGFQNKTPAWTYSLNEYAGNDWQGQNGVRTVTRAAKENPSKWLLYGEENAYIVPGYSEYTINNGALGVGRLGQPGSIVDVLANFHEPDGDGQGKSNALFADGHVQQVHSLDSKELCTPWRYRYKWGWTEGAAP
ncbi:MAG: type II secretion system protein [Phycisphaeraceae bacterium]